MSKPAVEFREVASGDAEDLARRMRAQDVAEVRAIGAEPLQAVERSIRMSTWCRSVWVGDRLAAIVGVAPFGSVLDPRGVPWLLGTDEVTRHARSLVRQARPYIRAMLALHPHLLNAVHADNAPALRFLRRLGFTIHDPVRLPSGALFHPFEMRA